MGIEYRISCPSESLPELDEFLRRAGGTPCAQFPHQLEFRFSASSPDELPDAMVVVEAEGLYFCDNGGPREPVAVLFREIIDKVLTISDSSESLVVTGL
jgi:hypothetical protein